MSVSIRHVRGDAIQSAAKWMGRVVMDEIDGILGKAEEYFGRKLTQIGLAIIAFGTIAAALRSIWTNFVRPFFGLTKAFPPFLTSNSIGLALELLLVFLIVSNYLKRRKADTLLKDTRKVQNSVEESLLDVNALQDEIRLSYQRSKDELEASGLLLAEIIKVSEATKIIPQETIDEIRSLLDTVLKTPM